MHSTEPPSMLCSCTWPCRWWGRTAITLSLSLAPPLQGAKRSVALILALAKATCSSGLQKNSHFLSGTRWGAPSFLCSPVLPCRLLSDLSSRGLVKITWQGRVKGPDEPRVPGVPQTSAELSVLLKWRGHWKGGASSRQGVSHYWICRKVARWVNKFLAHSKLLQPLGIKFNLHNMLEPLWCKWISFFFFRSVPGCNCCFTVDSYTVWIIVCIMLPGKTARQDPEGESNSGFGILG